MFEIIFLITVSIYFLVSALLLIGAKKNYPVLNDNELPSASVVVAARNEENNIQSCLESLNNLTFPNNKLEIIVVDDESTDNTRAKVEAFIKGKYKFRLIELKGQNTTKLTGKARAVAEGINNAEGEIILTTDADCEVNPLWAKTIVSFYRNDVAVVNGFTTIQDRNWFSGMQAIDFIYLLFVAAGTINSGNPVSCIGNNMSFRNKAYKETGGLEVLPFSVTEDFMLLKSIHDLKRYEVIYPVEKNALVISNPCSTLKDLFNQKKRWAVGGIDAPTLGKFLMLLAFVVNSFVLFTAVFFSPLWIYLVFFKIATDFFTLIPIHQKLGLLKNLKYFPMFQIYFILYTFVLPFILLFSKKIKWKGRTY